MSTPDHTPSPTQPRRLVGYARVSTEDQANDAQVDELKAAGCRIVHEEHGSGASRSRPVLAKLLRESPARSETSDMIRTTETLQATTG